jgi:hypothetical protein
MKWCHGQLDARESETWRNLPLTETVAFHLRFPKASGGGPPFSCTIGSRSHSPHLTPRQKPLARLDQSRPPGLCGRAPLSWLPVPRRAIVPVLGRKRTGSTRTLTHTAEPARHVRSDKGTRWRSRPQTWPVPVAPQIRSTIRVPSYWRGTSTWRRCASREGPAPSADVVLGTFYVFRDGQLR